MKSQKDDMKGPLDEIKKDNYFSIPDGYFEDLPGKIQERVIESPASSPSFGWRPVLRYALPVLFVGFLTFLFFRPTPEKQAEDILANISYDEAVEYLSETDLSLVEILPVVHADESIHDLIDLPTLEEEYILTEELLYSPEWLIEGDIEMIEDI